MTHCVHCGQEMPEAAKFCVHCGKQRTESRPANPFGETAYLPSSPANPAITDAEATPTLQSRSTLAGFAALRPSRLVQPEKPTPANAPSPPARSASHTLLGVGSLLGAPGAPGGAVDEKRPPPSTGPPAPAGESIWGGTTNFPSSGLGATSNSRSLDEIDPLRSTGQIPRARPSIPASIRDTQLSEGTQPGVPSIAPRAMADAGTQLEKKVAPAQRGSPSIHAPASPSGPSRSIGAPPSSSARLDGTDRGRTQPSPPPGHAPTTPSTARAGGRSAGGAREVPARHPGGPTASSAPAKKTKPAGPPVAYSVPVREGKTRRKVVMAADSSDSDRTLRFGGLILGLLLVAYFFVPSGPGGTFLWERLVQGAFNDVSFMLYVYPAGVGLMLVILGILSLPASVRGAIYTVLGLAPLVYFIVKSAAVEGTLPWAGSRTPSPRMLELAAELSWRNKLLSGLMFLLPFAHFLRARRWDSILARVLVGLGIAGVLVVYLLPMSIPGLTSKKLPIVALFTAFTTYSTPVVIFAVVAALPLLFALLSFGVFSSSRSSGNGNVIGTLFLSWIPLLVVGQIIIAAAAGAPATRLADMGRLLIFGFASQFLVVYGATHLFPVRRPRL